MRSNVTRALAALAGLLTLPLAAEDRYLLPAFVDVPGANGAAFISDFTLVNIGEHNVTVRGLRVPCPVPTCSVDYDFSLGARSMFKYFDKTGQPGLVLKAADGANLRMSLRVRDSSRAHLSAGTEVPVIHESEMYAGKVVLVDVPQAGLIFRNRLRVYSFAPGRVRVAVIQQADNAVLANFALDLRFPRDVPARAAEFYPAFAETTDIPAAISYLNIEVEPLEGVDRLWAFTTTTNNHTNEITVVTPQP